MDFDTGIHCVGNSRQHVFTCGGHANQEDEYLSELVPTKTKSKTPHTQHKRHLCYSDTSAVWDDARAPSGKVSLYLTSELEDVYVTTH